MQLLVQVLVLVLGAPAGAPIASTGPERGARVDDGCQGGAPLDLVDALGVEVSWHAHRRGSRLALVVVRHLLRDPVAGGVTGSRSRPGSYGTVAGSAAPAVS